MASGEKIIKHTEATVWQFIKSRLSDEITACETEGHGFLAALSPLKTFGMMIRGISDTLIGKDAKGKAQDDDNQNRASSYAAAFACQLISEIDSAALRGTRTGNVRHNASVVANVEELVSIEIVARLADVQTIIARLMEIARSVTMTVKKAEQGSIVLVLGMDRKSAVFSKALFDAKLLEGLLGHPILQCVSSATRSGDTQFDAWVDEVREGNLTGPAAAALSRNNTEWRLHGIKLQTHIRQQKTTQGEKKTMGANVYVEARPKGRPEGNRIDDYVVEDHADHVLGTFRTQREAIDWAKNQGHAPLVARVRHLNDKKRPDHWRAA